MTVYGSIWQRGTGEWKKQHCSREGKENSMHNHMQRQLVSNVVSHNMWLIHSTTRQSLHSKGITEPPFLPGDERTDGEGVIGKPIKH
jgi:hypothetical protein